MNPYPWRERKAKTKNSRSLFYWFVIFFWLSIIFLLIPGRVKIHWFALPRTIILAPLNITLNFFNNITNLKQENYRLTELATRLQIENAKLKEIIRKQNLKINLPNVGLLKAQIIGRDRETMGGYLLLDKGAIAGVKNNMPVITELGIVGKVIETELLQSLVETMLSKDSKIAGMNQRTRVNGIVALSPEKRGLCLNYIPTEAEIQIGDTIVSSGIGGIFPKGLLIGTVIKINKPKEALFQEILLKPSVNIYALEDVYIVTGGLTPLDQSYPKPIKSEKLKTDWEKALEKLKIEPPLEIKIR